MIGNVIIIRIMHIDNIDDKFIKAISISVQTVIKSCLIPKIKIISGPNVRYFFVRSMARDTELFDHFPLLPSHAADILDLLHDYFYLRGNTI